MLADLSAGGGQAQVLSWGVNFTAVPEPINVALGVFGGARWGFTGCAGGGDVPDRGFPDCRHREAVSPTVCASSAFELLASSAAKITQRISRRNLAEDESRRSPGSAVGQPPESRSVSRLGLVLRQLSDPGVARGELSVYCKRPLSGGVSRTPRRTGAIARKSLAPRSERHITVGK